MARKNGKEISGINKKGQVVQLPDSIIESILKEGSFANEFVVDGEIIGEVLHIFDIISLNGDCKKIQPCIGRLNLLGTMKFGPNIEIVKTAYTKEEKQKLYDELKVRNAEGIVFKKKNSLYTAGRPSSGGSQLKNKFYKEASFIVKDFTKGKRSVGLELINEDGDRVFMGKCTIPPNKDIPEVGSVVEVRYLYAYKGGAVFQPVFKEQRNDVDVEECLMTQIIYKAGQESDEEE